MCIQLLLVSVLLLAFVSPFSSSREFSGFTPQRFFKKIQDWILKSERILGCVSLRKSKIGFLNRKESENGFCVSLLDRSIQDISDHGASKEPKNPLFK